MSLPVRRNRTLISSYFCCVVFVLLLTAKLSRSLRVCFQIDGQSQPFGLCPTDEPLSSLEMSFFGPSGDGRRLAEFVNHDCHENHVELTGSRGHLETG